MDLLTLQYYLDEEWRPLCIMEEGGRGDQTFHVQQQRDELILKQEKDLGCKLGITGGHQICPLMFLQ